jgi:hypothetical protein
MTDSGMTQEEFMKLRNWRYIEPNEIVIEFDEFPQWNVYIESHDAIDLARKNIEKAGYFCEIYDHGGKSYHLHIKDFEKDLSPEYKKAFIKKYVPEKYINVVDYSLCSNKHCIAEENKKHWKTGLIKGILWETTQECVTNRIEPEIEKSIVIPEKRNDILPTTNLTAKIVARVKITDVARKYGFTLRGSMAICKFHGERTPSLHFDNSKGVFYCHACHIKGNIIEFVIQCKKHGFTKNG